MNKSLKYENDLITSLTKLFEIKSELKKLEKAEEKIKDRIRKWMVLNELEKYNVADFEGHKWSIGKYSTNRQSIIDLKLLKSLVGDSQYPLVIKESTSEYYKISSPDLNWEKD